MIPYDRSIDPPAPVVEVIIRHPTTGVWEALSAQLDTGADISGIPQRLVDRLGLAPVRVVPIEGYDDARVLLSTYIVRLEVAGVRFRGVEVVPIPGERTLLGRDVLNCLYIHLNGPELTFDLSPSPPG